ncbi:MAG: motility protein A [Lachnospiraceae bacterium]|nr:MAG: motility protein A [Lachnospiraceae bacterium]
MDLSTLIGLVLGICMTLYGIISSGASVNSYIDVPSIIITIGGSLSSLLTSMKLPDLINSFKNGIKQAVQEPKNSDPKKVITQIIDMANVARKEGLLTLEETANSLDDEFMKKGLLLIVDGTDADLVRSILENDMNSMYSRHQVIIGMFDFWAAQGPAWGMIGTLIGLINMLKDLQDASTIGPNMAVALITTFYGSLIANWICQPIENKLKVNTDNEISIKTLVVEGLLSIQAGENPRVIEEKLKTFLPPADRASVAVGDEKGGEA